MGSRTGTPLWKAVLLLLLSAMFLVEGREVGVKPAISAASSWASCQQTVCARVRDEAEGLARLKLLRGYVTETVKLLDSLMDSMDSELVGIAKEMKEFVGPRCEAAHQMLEQVAEVIPRRDFELSAGIMEETTAQRVVDKQTSRGQELDDDIEQEGDDSDSQGWSSPGNYSPGIDERRNGVQTSFSNRQGLENQQSSSSSSFSSSMGYGIENTANSVYSEEEDTQTGQQVWREGRGEESPARRGKGRQLDQGPQRGTTWGSGGGGGSRGNNQGYNSAEDSYQTSSSNQYNSAVSHTGGSSGSRLISGGTTSGSSSSSGGSSSGSSSWRPVPMGPNCRGRKGSPFAVPGIDDWCLQNCARGYCPQTHCSCD